MSSAWWLSSTMGWRSLSLTVSSIDHWDQLFKFRQYYPPRLLSNRNRRHSKLNGKYDPSLQKSLAVFPVSRYWLSKKYIKVSKVTMHDPPKGTHAILYLEPGGVHFPPLAPLGSTHGQMYSFFICVHYSITRALKRKNTSRSSCPVPDALRNLTFDPPAHAHVTTIIFWAQLVQHIIKVPNLLLFFLRYIHDLFNFDWILNRVRRFWIGYTQYWQLAPYLYPR